MASFPEGLGEDTDELSPLVTQEQRQTRGRRLRLSRSSRSDARRPVSISEAISTVRRHRTSSQSSSADEEPRPRWSNPFKPDVTVSDDSEPVPSTSGTEADQGGAGDDDDDDGTELTGCAGNCCCHPRAFCHRITALMLMCLLGFGSYFCFDNPGALQGEIKDAMGVSTYQFANLYAWYSWPNVVLPVVGGYLMDSIFGIRLGTIIFASFIILGQGMFSGGAFMNSFTMMQVGRFVFGIGGESLAVAQNTYAVSWFKGKELNMVFGFQLSIARVGSTVNFLVMAPLYAWLSQWHVPNEAVGWTLTIAGSTCVMSFVCALVLGCLDKRAERLLRKEKAENADVVRIMDIFEFPLAFWLLSIVCLSYYVAIFPFISLGQVFFMKKFGFTKSNANFINGLIYLISAPASPLLGYLIDRTGRNVGYVFFSFVVTIVCHTMLAFSFWNPYIAISIMGLAYSLLASSLWPIAALVIPEYQLGTAYGIMQAIQNAGLGLATLLAGLIVDRHGYIWLELFFVMWLVIGLVCTAVIWVLDVHGNGYLNMGVEQRECFDAAKKRKEEEAAKSMARRRMVLRPRTATELRNRYLCRIGAVLPPHQGHSGLNVVRNADGSIRPPNEPIVTSESQL